MRARRRINRPSDLTSMFDVLFIVVFAALIRAAAVQAAADRAAEPPPRPPEPAKPLDPASLKARAVADLSADLASRPAIVVRVSGTGTIVALELDGKRETLDVPLLEQAADPDVKVTYLGDRSAELRVCQVAALHAKLADLSHHLVVIAPQRRLVDLPHALYDGLHRDLDRCLTDQRGLATIVDPKP